MKILFIARKYCLLLKNKGSQINRLFKIIQPLSYFYIIFKFVYKYQKFS